MIRLRARAAIACAAIACVAAAWPRAARAHGGVPERVVTNRRVGPYVVSVWASPDIGMGMVYVVYDAPAGAPFVAPASVRVGVMPASGRVPEAVLDAHPEAVRHGARYVVHVPFDRAESWRVRVLTAGAGAGGEVAAVVSVPPADRLGPMGILFYASPFLAVAGVWGRAAAARRRAPAARPALASS